MDMSIETRWNPVTLGKSVRLARIFGHPSGRLMSVAVDHFTGHDVMAAGLHDLPKTIATLVAGRPDAITMFKGVASSCWPAYAGVVPLIVQVGCFTVDERIVEILGGPAQAIRLGADAIAVAIGVRGPNEGRFLQHLSSVADEADQLGLPVIAHVYPRDFAGEPRIVNDLDNVSWAIRCAIECGADVVKVPLPDQAAGFGEVIAASPIPVVMAGGSRAENLEQALEQAQTAMRAGAAGITVGRNIWGAADPQAAMRAFQAVVHDLEKPAAALSLASADPAAAAADSPVLSAWIPSDGARMPDTEPA